MFSMFGRLDIVHHMHIDEQNLHYIPVDSEHLYSSSMTNPSHHDHVHNDATHTLNDKKNSKLIN